MTEFTHGILTASKSIYQNNKGSILRTIIYTIGHMFIAGTTVYVMPGSTLWEAGAVALVEPALNSIWFYMVHKTWVVFSE